MSTEAMTPEGNSGDLTTILAGLRRQVEWNGWEEPYVTERLTQELAKAGLALVPSARIDALEKALRPFAEKFLYPDDTGYTDETRAGEDWDETANDETMDEVWIKRKWVRNARAALPHP